MKKVSDKKLQEIINFIPHKNQQKVLDCEARDIVLDAGRGFGKSILAAYLAMRTLLINDKKIVIVAPTYDLAQKPFNYLQQWIAKGFPKMMAGISLRPFPQIKTPWGTQLYCRSTENPVGILGERCDLSIIEEASRIKKSIYESYIFPLSSQGGKSIFISTPFGKNLFYNKWLEAKETDSAFHFTSRDNPYLAKGEWERAKQKLPEQVFKQEYMAQFLEDAASVFRGVRDIIKDDCLKDVISGHYYVMGVDLGKHEDFTVLTVIDRYNSNVVAKDRFKKIDYPFQKKRITALAKRYNNARIIVDSTGVGEPIRDDLRRDEKLVIDDFKFSGKSKPELIEKLSIYIEQKKVWIPSWEPLIDELESFGYQLTNPKTGEPLKNVRYGAPQGLHDDCVDSLALAVWGLTGQAKPLTAFQERIKQRSQLRIKNQNYI